MPNLLVLSLPDHHTRGCYAAYLKVWLRTCLGVSADVGRWTLTLDEDAVVAIRALFGGSTAAASLGRLAPATLAALCVQLGVRPATNMSGQVDGILRCQAAATVADVMHQALAAAAADVEDVEVLLGAHHLAAHRAAAAQHPVPMPAASTACIEKVVVDNALAARYGPGHDPALATALCAELAVRRSTVAVEIDIPCDVN